VEVASKAPDVIPDGVVQRKKPGPKPKPKPPPAPVTPKVPEKTEVEVVQRKKPGRKPKPKPPPVEVASELDVEEELAGKAEPTVQIDDEESVEEPEIQTVLPFREIARGTALLQNFWQAFAPPTFQFGGGPFVPEELSPTDTDEGDAGTE
jgi:hypothetical protein